MSSPSAPPYDGSDDSVYDGGDDSVFARCSTEPNDVALDFFRNVVSLSIVCFASWKIAAFAQRLSLPRGSGFLLTGMLAGTFVDTIRNLDHDQKRSMIKGLDCKYEILVNSNKCQPGSGEFFMSFPINYVCMSFIAYATGSELVYSRYKKLLKKMVLITSMITLSIYIFVSSIFQLLLSSDNARAFFKYYPTNFDPNSCDAADAAGDVVLLSASDRSQCDLKEVMKENASLRWAVALLVGAVLTSRSPASAISIVGEMRANGDFTKTGLGVTIFMYVGVVVTFSITQAISMILVGGVEPSDATLNATTNADDANATANAYADADASSSALEAANATSADGDGEDTCRESTVAPMLVIGSVITSLVLSVLVGLLLGVLLYVIIGLPIRPLLKQTLRLRSPLFEVAIKAALSLACGCCTFLMRLGLKEASQLAEQRGVTSFKFRVEPLFSCLIGGVVVVNIRKGARAEEWKRMCKTIAPYVYCVFFTLAGGSVNFTGQAMLGGLVLVFVRFVGVLVGSSVGGMLAREPTKFIRLSWMNYITQAGVALGFAQEIKEEYGQQLSSALPDGSASIEVGLREYMTTMADLIIVVVFINQIIGPPFFKFALRLSGEAYIDRIGGAQLLTIEGQAPQIQMRKVAWEVRAGPRGSRVAQVVPGRTQMKLSQEVDRAQLEPLMGDTSDGMGGGGGGGGGGLRAAAAASNLPFISMLEDDQSNFDACKLVQSLYGTRRCIVQQIDPAWKQRFNDIGGLVVDPASLVMDSLEQFLGSTQSATMLLHSDPLAEVVRVHVDMDTAGQVVQNLRLPQSVQVLEVRRHGCDLAPRPFTTIRYDDELMLVGRPNMLAQVTAIKKGKVVLVLGSKRKNSKESQTSYTNPDQTSVVREVSAFSQN